MSTSNEGKNNKNKKIAADQSKNKGLSIPERKEIADKEEEVLAKQIEDLKKWTDTVGSMSDEQLKEYLENRPEELKTVKLQKSKPRRKVQKAVKSKAATYTGIMASVWKFHKEDDDGDKGYCSSKTDHA